MASASADRTAPPPPTQTRDPFPRRSSALRTSLPRKPSRAATPLNFQIIATVERSTLLSLTNARPVVTRTPELRLYPVRWAEHRARGKVGHRTRQKANLFLLSKSLEWFIESRFLPSLPRPHLWRTDETIGKLHESRGVEELAGRPTSEAGYRIAQRTNLRRGSSPLKSKNLLLWPI